MSGHTLYRERIGERVRCASCGWIGPAAMVGPCRYCVDGVAIPVTVYGCSGDCGMELLYPGATCRCLAYRECGTCEHWDGLAVAGLCGVHNETRTSEDSCDSWSARWVRIEEKERHE